jgi:arylsulfatase A-like enzyme/peptidoglycan/LPS O-acetylase OafA/YrhL
MLGTYRTMLALVVMLGHLWLPNWVGTYAVFGFYVLSGFLMTRIMDERYGHTLAGRSRFAVNRILRLFPLYYLACLFSLICILAIGEDESTRFHGAMSLPRSASEIAANLSMIFPSFYPTDFKPRLVPATWALTVELLNYCAIALGISRTAKRAGVWLALSLAYVMATFAWGASWEARYFPALAACLPFSVGSLIHFASKRAGSRPSTRTRPAHGLILVLLFGLNLAAILLLHQRGAGSAAIEVGFYVSFILCAAAVPLLARMEPSPALQALDRRVGQLSYPIYLFHWPLALGLWAALPAMAESNESHRSAALFFLSLGVIVPLSAALARLVDTPIEKLRARFKPDSLRVTRLSSSGAEPLVRSRPAMLALLLIGPWLIVHLVSMGLDLEPEIYPGEARNNREFALAGSVMTALEPVRADKPFLYPLTLQAAHGLGAELESINRIAYWALLACMAAIATPLIGPAATLALLILTALLAPLHFVYGHLRAEALFTALAMGSLLATLHYGRRPTRARLGVLAITLGLACATRYMGLFWLVPTAALNVLLIHRVEPRRGLWRGLAVSGGALLILSPYLLSGYLRTGLPMGMPRFEQRPILQRLFGYEYGWLGNLEFNGPRILHHAIADFGSLGGAYSVDVFPGSWVESGLGFIVLISLLVVFFLWSRFGVILIDRLRRGPPIAREDAAYFLSIEYFVGFMSTTAVIWTIGNNDPIYSRFLIPAYPFLLLAAFLTAARLPRGWPRISMVGLYVILLTTQASRLGLLQRLGVPASPSRPNIVLISIDTLRSDHVSGLGYGRPTTPVLDALARDGTIFTRAYSTASWTAPAIVSLLTGRYPLEHGITRGRGGGRNVFAQSPLPGALPYLPRLLRTAGYRTLGLTANGHLARELAFDQGFDRYECIGFGDGAEIEAKITAWTPDRPGRRPTFIWLHFLDPHLPYRAQGPWIREAWPEPPSDDEALAGATSGVALHGLGVSGLRLDYLRALYDSEIQRVDAIIGRVLARIDDPRHTLVVVTADHGEEFLEHGDFGHGHSLYEEVIRVPLIIRQPEARMAGLVIDTPVSLIDVAPTILSVAGLETESFSGHDLANPAGPPTERTLFASNDRIVPMRAAIRGNEKLIVLPKADGRDERFDLRADPREQSPATTSLRTDDSLLEALRTHESQSRLRRPVIAPPAIVSKSDEEAMRALGYLE